MRGHLYKSISGQHPLCSQLNWLQPAGLIGSCALETFATHDVIGHGSRACWAGGFACLYGATYVLFDLESTLLKVSAANAEVTAFNESSQKAGRRAIYLCLRPALYLLGNLHAGLGLFTIKVINRPNIQLVPAPLRKPQFKPGTALQSDKDPYSNPRSQPPSPQKTPHADHTPV